MAVREDCRHYVMQTVANGDRLERCRLEVNEATPFACPDGCLFEEPRSTSRAGWRVPGPPPDRRRP